MGGLNDSAASARSNASGGSREVASDAGISRIKSRAAADWLATGSGNTAPAVGRSYRNWSHNNADNHSPTPAAEGPGRWRPGKVVE